MKCTCELHPQRQFMGFFRQRGTYAGVMEKIPYLKELGVTAVELMPIHQFDGAGRAAGVDQLLGIQHAVFFFAAQALQLQA